MAFKDGIVAPRSVQVAWSATMENGSRPLRVRDSALGLKRLYLGEAYNDTLVSHELSVGALWHFP